MVKSGRGFISCNTCQKGIGVITNIDRNSNNWELVHSGECVHFQFSIDCLTRSSYFYLNDEINFVLNCICKRCNSERSLNAKCTGINNDSGIEVKECCSGTKSIFQYEFNSFLQTMKKGHFTDSNLENCCIQYSPNLTKITYKNLFEL